MASAFSPSSFATAVTADRSMSASTTAASSSRLAKGLSPPARYPLPSALARVPPLADEPGVACACTWRGQSVVKLDSIAAG
jgi:hypothetical protein